MKAEEPTGLPLWELFLATVIVCVGIAVASAAQNPQQTKQKAEMANIKKP